MNSKIVNKLKTGFFKKFEIINGINGTSHLTKAEIECKSIEK